MENEESQEPLTVKRKGEFTWRRKKKKKKETHLQYNRHWVQKRDSENNERIGALIINYLIYERISALIN